MAAKTLGEYKMTAEVIKNLDFGIISSIYQETSNHGRKFARYLRQLRFEIR